MRQREPVNIMIRCRRLRRPEKLLFWRSHINLLVSFESVVLLLFLLYLNELFICRQRTHAQPGFFADQNIAGKNDQRGGVTALPLKISAQRGRTLLRNLALQATVAVDFVALANNNVTQQVIVNNASCLPNEIFCLPVLLRDRNNNIEKQRLSANPDSIACARRQCNRSSILQHTFDSTADEKNYSDIANLHDGDPTSVWVSRPVGSSEALQVILRLGIGQFQIEQINLHFQGFPPAQIVVEALAPHSTVNSSNLSDNLDDEPDTITDQKQWFPLAHLKKLAFLKSAADSTRNNATAPQPPEQILHTIKHRLDSSEFGASTSAVRITLIGHNYPPELHSARSLIHIARVLDVGHIDGLIQPDTNASHIQQLLIQRFFSYYALSELQVYGHCSSGYFGSDLLDYFDNIILRCLRCNCSAAGSLTTSRSKKNTPKFTPQVTECNIKNGQCPCREQFTGRQCLQCFDGSANVRDDCRLTNRPIVFIDDSTGVAALATVGNNSVSYLNPTFAPAKTTSVNTSRFNIFASDDDSGSVRFTTTMANLAGRRPASPHNSTLGPTSTVATYDFTVQQQQQPVYEYWHGNLEPNNSSVSKNFSTLNVTIPSFNNNNNYTTPVLLSAAIVPAASYLSHDQQTAWDAKLTTILVLAAVILFFVLLYGLLALLRWFWSRRGSFTPYFGGNGDTRRDRDNRHINTWLTQNFGTTRRAQSTTTDNQNVPPLGTPPLREQSSYSRAAVLGNSRTVVFPASSDGIVAGLTMERGEAPANLVNSRFNTNYSGQYAMEELATPSPPSAGATGLGSGDNDSGLAGIQHLNSNNFGAAGNNSNQSKPNSATGGFVAGRQQPQRTVPLSSFDKKSGPQTNGSSKMVIKSAPALATVSAVVATKIGSNIERNQQQRSVESRVMEERETPVVMDLTSDEDEDKIFDKIQTTQNSNGVDRKVQQTSFGKPTPVVENKLRTKTSLGVANPAFEPSHDSDDPESVEHATSAKQSREATRLDGSVRSKTQPAVANNTPQTRVDDDSEYITFDLRSDDSIASPEKVLQRRHSRQEPSSFSRLPVSETPTAPNQRTAGGERIFSISSGSTVTNGSGGAARRLPVESVSGNQPASRNGAQLQAFSNYDDDNNSIEDQVSSSPSHEQLSPPPTVTNRSQPADVSVLDNGDDDPFQFHHAYSPGISHVFGKRVLNDSYRSDTFDAQDVIDAERTNGDLINRHDMNGDIRNLPPPPAGKLVRWHANNFERLTMDTDGQVQQDVVKLKKPVIANGFSGKNITTEL